MSRLQLVTIDFETYFGTRCNIKSLGTSQYVGHPDFHVHCMGYKTPKMKRAAILRGRNINEFFERLRTVADRVVLCAHNVYFDGYVAALHYGFHPSRYLCTMAMAKPHYGQYMSTSLETLCQHLGIGDGKMKDVLPKWRNKRWKDMPREDCIEMARYCQLDVELTEQLLRHLAPLMPREELDLLDLTIRLFTEPAFVVDTEKAQAIIEEEQTLKREACKSAGVEATQLRSNDQFAGLLRAEGVEVPMKISPTTGKESYAFAKADLSFTALLEHEKERVRKLVEARITNKTSINETRAKAMLDRSKSPVPIYLGYCAAHTFRFGGGDKFNAQNLPRDGRLRACLRAPDGYKIVSADASQIEARDNAVFSGQWDLVDEFAAGVDVYCSFAEDIYGYPVNKNDNPDERFVGKTGILGLGYQCGAWKFQNMLEVGAFGPSVVLDVADVQRIVDTYRTKYYAIKDTWWQLQKLIPVLLDSDRDPIEFRGIVIEPGGTVLMPNGLRMHYPGLSYELNPEWNTAEYTYYPYDTRFKKVVPKKLYGGAWLENIIQCRCRIITASHALRLSRHYKVVLLVHDEIVMCVPEKKAAACLRDAIEIMSEPPDWNPKIPLAAEGKITDFYVK